MWYYNVHTLLCYPAVVCTCYSKTNISLLVEISNHNGRPHTLPARELARESSRLRYVGCARESIRPPTLQWYRSCTSDRPVQGISLEACKASFVRRQNPSPQMMTAWKQRRLSIGRVAVTKCSTSLSTVEN